MGLFSDLKLNKNKQGNLRVTYMGKPLMVIHIGCVHEIIKDYATNAFLTKISRLVHKEDATDETVKRALKFESLYTKEKKKFFKRKRINSIKVGTRDFEHIIKATKLCEQYEVTLIQYLKAQVDGLSFLNDGKGVFPTPSQLTNSSAEQRVLSYITKDEVDNGDDFELIKITYDDKQTPIMENARFVRYRTKVLNKTASRREATYCYDLMMAIRGNVHATISDYLDGLDE